MNEIQYKLEKNAYTSNGSISYWFPLFYNDYCVGEKAYIVHQGEGDTGFWNNSFDGDNARFSLADKDRLAANDRLAAKGCTDGGIKTVQARLHDFLLMSIYFSEIFFKIQFLTFLSANTNFLLDFKFSRNLKQMSRAELYAGAFEITVRPI
jgi:hypothetical protein